MHNNEFEVRIIQDSKQYVLKARSGRRLKELISAAGIFVPYPCGGNGRCGKCVISFDKGAPTPNDTDKNFLSKEELAGGKRILCRCVLEKECVIRLGDETSREDIAAVSIETGETDRGISESEIVADDPKFLGFGVAIDLGTTTIAAALVGTLADGGKTVVIRTASAVNHQRNFGFDVISRIEAASDNDKRKELQKTAQCDIAELLRKLLAGMKIKISGICIAGNTTMLHLLRGYDVSGLGSFPYRPVTTDMETIEVKDLCGDEGDNELWESFSDARITVMPGISAFVGADIVSGIYSLDMTVDAGQKILFLDLGTNGEMAYFDGKELIVTSTAAGPVFEGGGISCGVASVPGAVSHVTITGDNPEEYRVSFETIGGMPAIGICGTGVIEAASELARCGIIDKDGLFAEAFFEKGFVIDKENDIRITQKDVRNVQLAKAAIRSGMERLLDGDEPDKVYVAGGFGANLDASKLQSLNLFPENLLDKIRSVGNTSLKGCVRYLEEADPDKTEKITKMAKELTLALEDGFGEAYIDALGF